MPFLIITGSLLIFAAFLSVAKKCERIYKKILNFSGDLFRIYALLRAISNQLDTGDAFEHLRAATTDNALRRVALEAAVIALDIHKPHIEITHEPAPNTRRAARRKPRANKKGVPHARA